MRLWREVLRRRHAVADDRVNLRIGPHSAHRVDHPIDGGTEAFPARASRRALRNEQYLRATVERDEPALPVPLERCAPHPLDERSVGSRPAQLSKQRR